MFLAECSQIWLVGLNEFFGDKRAETKLSWYFFASVLIRTLLALLLYSGVGTAEADWAGFSRYAVVAEINVESKGVSLNLRMAPRAIPSDEVAELSTSGVAPPWLANLLPLILGESGNPLSSQLLSLGKAEALAKDGSKEAYYQAFLEFPLDHPLKSLTIVPPQQTAQAIGLVTLHRGVPVSDLVPFDKKVTLNLDWQDPWFTHFDDPSWIRRHSEPHSYLYVEPYEVRHELLIPLKELTTFFDLGLKNPPVIAAAEIPDLKKRLGEFLMQRNLLSVDGNVVSPELDRVEFLKFTQEGLVPLTDKSANLAVETALVGVVLVYLTEEPAKAVDLHWDLFTSSHSTRLVSLVQGQETFDMNITVKAPDFHWSADEDFEPIPNAKVEETKAESEVLPVLQGSIQHSSLLRPVLGVLILLLMGALLLFTPRQFQGQRTYLFLGGLTLFLGWASLQWLFIPWAQAGSVTLADLPEAQAKLVLHPMLHNAYRAFQLRGEEKAYDRLAKSLDGDLLDDIYLQQRKALLRQAEGLGGEGKVNRIEILGAKAQPSGDHYAVTSRWMAHGTVSHWGHSHDRHNLYEARLNLKPMPDGHWKIIGLEFIGGKRLETGKAG